jgi:protein required for attachment to host cells
MKAVLTWVVVADAGRARFFERRGAKANLLERNDLAMTAPAVETPRDRPPRVHDRMGAGRHIIEPRATPRSAAHTHFLAEVGRVINEAAERGAFDKLTICAPPRALGLLRDCLSDTTKVRVTTALHKDFIHDPVHVLQAHLDALAP